MSEIARVLKNKNKVDKENRKRRSKEIRNMREFTMYRNRLSEDMKEVELILEDEDVSSITVSLGNDKVLSMFLQFIYLEELAEYTVTQIDNYTYSIRRKIINI